MSYSDVVATIALFVSFIGTFASGYISYHYAIKGEKRKEFNSVADRVTLSLMQQRDTATNGTFPNVTLGKTDLHALLIVTKHAERAGLQKAFSDYEEALKSCGEWKAGFYSFKSSDTLKAAIDALLKFAERK